MELINSDLSGSHPIELKIEGKKKHASERGDFITLFTNEINKERPCKYIDKKGKERIAPKLKEKDVAIKVGHLKKISELTFLLSVCNDARNRGKSFSKEFHTQIMAR